MNVAVTSQGKDMTSDVDPRLGRSRFLVVVDTDTGQLAAHDNSETPNTVQDPGSEAARKVVQLGIKTLITGNIGNQTLAILEAGNVEAWTGPVGSVGDAVERFKAGQLEKGNQLHDEKYYWT